MSRGETGSGAPAGAVVTGAGRGLGREIAALLVERGHTVLVTDVDGEAAAATAGELGARALAMRVDVRDEAQVEAAREEITARTGRLDVWVNNAGVLVTGPAWTQDEATRRLVFEVNALGTVNGTLAAVRAMRGQGAGHIVNVVSLAGITAVPGEAVYAASKHAAIGFSLSTLADLRLDGVRGVHISCVCPDGIWTPMLHDRLDDPGAALSFSGRLLEPREVVRAVGRVLDRPRPVTALPRWRGLQARFADVLPAVGLRAVPLAEALGRRTQRRMLRSRAAREARKD